MPAITSAVVVPTFQRYVVVSELAVGVVRGGGVTLTGKQTCKRAWSVRWWSVWSSWSITWLGSELSM